MYLTLLDVHERPFITPQPHGPERIAALEMGAFART